MSYMKLKVSHLKNKCTLFSRRTCASYAASDH